VLLQLLLHIVFESYFESKVESTVAKDDRQNHTITLIELVKTNQK